MKSIGGVKDTCAGDIFTHTPNYFSIYSIQFNEDLAVIVLLEGVFSIGTDKAALMITKLVVIHM